jgi:DNA-binding transcriptional ArsR family regulator
MDLTAPRSDRGCDVDDVAEIMAALASPSRLAIVRILAETELDVGEIAERLGASVATTSHHLGPLRRAGLVTSRRDGTRLLNRIAGPRVLDLCAAACAMAPAREPAAARR